MSSLRIPTMDVTNHPFAAKTHVKKWRCDVCQTRYFKTFDEACAHEETCQQPKEQQQPQQQHEEAKQTAPAHSFFAPRKPAATGKRSKSCAKQQKKDTTPQHCFFEPLSKKPKTSTKTPVIKIEESPTFKGEESKTTVIDILNQHQQQLQQQKQKRKEEADLQFLASVKKKKPKKQKLPQEPITVENAHDMANSLAAMIADDISSSSSKQPLAAFFSSKPSKELLAEQRQAEFQAKRRLERRKEIERQQKRQARTIPEPTTHAKQLSTNSSSSSSNLLPLAPRFPVPSHVVSSETCMPSRVQVVTPPGWNKPNASFDTTTTTAAAGRQETKKLISSPSALDSSSIEPEGGDDLMIQTALQDVLRPSSSTLNDDHNDGQLWVDKYANPLIGSSTLQAAQELQLWIQEWCQARQTAMNRMMERQRKLTTSKNNKKKKRRKTIYKPDDDLWEGDDDNNKLGNVFLLTGPPSSGKTSLVHYVAAKCRCPVLEINTTQARGGAALKNAIQEATQSCSSLDLIKRQYKKLDAFADSEEDDDEQGSSSLTVILIDEVDFLFDEHGDAAFWTALSSVAKTAKCPIFLTANTMPRQMKLLQSYQYLELEKPLPDECMTKLVQVCRQEGISTKPELDPEAVKAKLSRVAQVCDCDVRRMLHELQSFVHSTASTESKVSNMKAWKDASLACAPAKLPCLHSAKPVLVLAEQYSVVTVTGKNFGFLHRAKNEWNVVIGQRNCKAHVVDEETLLVLCPPYQDDGLMAAPISIRFANGLVLNGDRVETDERPGGSHLPGRQRLYVNYQFLEDEECTSSDDEECEFGGNNSSEEKRKKWTIDESAKKSIEQKGMMMWDTVAAAANTVQCNPPTTTSPKDRELLATLESLSDDAQRLSDAAILEDGQYGLPFLSGACMGFGFDMTDCNQGEDGKLKMHDKIRPYVLFPSLVSLFYGNSSS
jgi:DNA polymerase III delta prime subunit